MSWRRPAAALAVSAGLAVFHTWPLARAAAEPPDEPPQVREVCHGLRVSPNTSLKVCEPSPNSGVFVLPIRIAPAPRTRSTIAASSAGT